MRAAPALLALLVVATACKGDPAVPATPDLEIVVVSGDQQFGPVSGVIEQPLRVQVRRSDSGTPRADEAVVWSVPEGDATFVTASANSTDSAGVSEARIRLGATVGTIRIRATVAVQETATTDFELFAVDRPVLTSLSAGEGAAGGSLVLGGSGFSPVAEQNVVLFSGIRAAVSAASATELTVEVPPCLPTRSVQVTAQLGALVSASLPFFVQESQDPISLAPGEVRDVTDDRGCLRLSGEGGARYLAVVQSASTVGVAMHDFTFSGLSDAGATHSLVEHEPLRWGPTESLSPQRRWHDTVRELEKDLTRGIRSRPPVGPPRAAAAVPTVGMRRSFQVLNADRELDDVEAVARFVGDEVALFVDESSPAGGFTTAELADFAARFDEVIHPAVTETFGDASDLDGDERITVLLTPTVNRMTPRGSNGFIGGFFYGVDLLPELTGSNGSEIFYTLVPDPQGVLSDARSSDDLLDVVPGILAHEFQHMVHFNERRLVLGAATSDATWLREGLAQAAEEIVARRYAVSGDADGAELFRIGNRGRSRRYLADPSAVSVVFGTGAGTLEERGAGVLHLLYLSAQLGDDIFEQLTKSTQVGVENVASRSGRNWPTLLSDWWSAIALDEKGGSGVLAYPDMDLPHFLGGPGFPLRPDSIGAGDFTRRGSLWSSSARYYIVVPSLHGSMTLRLAGDAGSAAPSGSELRLRLIRLP